MHHERGQPFAFAMIKANQAIKLALAFTVKAFSCRRPDSSNLRVHVSLTAFTKKDSISLRNWDYHLIIMIKINFLLCTHNQEIVFVNKDPCTRICCAPLLGFEFSEQTL